MTFDSIVDDVLNSCSGNVSALNQERLLIYMRLLASTGKTRDQLLTFGVDYLRELLEPDPRYTGC